MPSGPAAAREMTGGVAFDRARASAKMAASANLQAAEGAVMNRLEEVVVTGAGRRDETKRAGGKVLSKRNGVWTDLAHRDSLTVTSIAPFSKAWFALAEARPALREALAAGSPLILAGRRASLKIIEGGVSDWAPGAMDRFLREFEGR
jgi:putative intracellular protease/amidase